MPHENRDWSLLNPHARRGIQIYSGGILRGCHGLLRQQDARLCLHGKAAVIA
jgi:hypothetical protein